MFSDGVLTISFHDISVFGRNFSMQLLSVGLRDLVQDPGIVKRNYEVR